jgi:Outer membrane protein beta-barrel domain
MLHKILYGTLAVSLLLVSASAADAQFASPIRFNIHGGAAAPMGDFGDNAAGGGGADLGFRIGAGLELRAPLMPVGLRFDGAFDRMGIEGADAAYSIWSVTGNAVIQPMVSPLYFIGGVGFYGTDLTGSDADLVFGNFNSETDFGFNLGAGFSLPLTGFSTFIEARWHRISVDSNVFGFDSISYVPIVFGLRF